MSKTEELNFVESGDSPGKKSVWKFLFNSPMTLEQLEREPRCDGSCNGKDCTVAETSCEAKDVEWPTLAVPVTLMTKAQLDQYPHDYDIFRGIPSAAEKTVVQYHAYANRAKLLARLDEQYAADHDVTLTLFQIMQSYAATSHKSETIRKRNPIAFDKLQDELTDIVLESRQIAHDKGVTKKLSHLVNRAINNAVKSVWESAEYEKDRRNTYEAHVKHETAERLGYSSVKGFEKGSRADRKLGEEINNDDDVVTLPEPVVVTPEDDDQGFNEEENRVIRAADAAALPEADPGTDSDAPRVHTPLVTSVHAPLLTRRQQANLRKKSRKTKEAEVRRAEKSSLVSVPAKVDQDSRITRRQREEALSAFIEHHSADANLQSVATHYGGDKSVDDIANETGISVHTVERIITKIRKGVKEAAENSLRVS